LPCQFATSQRPRKRPTRPVRNKADSNVPLPDRASGDDVGDNAVGKLLDFILEDQFPLFHPRQLELVAIAAGSKQLDFLVEAAVLDFQQRQNLPRIIVIHASILQEGRTIVTRAAVIAEPLLSVAETV
jgi:hypothetical protein